MLQYPGSTLGPSTIDTTYTPTGVQTVTQAPGMPTSNFDQLYALMGQRFNKPKKMGGKGVNQAAPVTSRVHNDTGKNVAPRGPGWQAIQGSATRPVGLGAQMIPGMQVNQEMLPPHMRHKSTQFQEASSSGGAGGSKAGLSPSAPAKEQDGGPSAEERWFKQFGSVPAWMRK